MSAGVSPHEAQGDRPDPIPRGRDLALETPAIPDSLLTALVLSGGGSRGLAHAGALEGLERLGYDPDIVVGTSMGALIGAMYAAGYGPEEIQARIVERDWGEIFTAAPLVLGPDRRVFYPILVLDSDPDPRRFNRGVVPQWRANRLLAHLLFDANARARGDFDRLARRYRAVTADLQTGEIVVLGGGDLARAARASMGVPGIMAPIEWEGRFLVDGGLADNLPVGVARELGAERILAVDVRIPSEEILGRTPLQVANRALELMMRRARRDTIPPDVLVVPAIPATTAGVVFPPDPSVFFDLGREAALRDAGPADATRPERRPLPPAPASFGALRVEAPDRTSEALVRRVFARTAPGPYDPEQVLEALDRLYTTGFFEAIWPRVESNGSEAAPDLVVRVDRPPRIALATAVGYDDDRGGRVWLALQRTGTVLRAPAMATAAGFLTPLQQWIELSSRVLLPAWPVLSWSGGAHVRETDVRRFGPDRLPDQDVLRAGAWLGMEIHEPLSARIAAAALRAEWVAIEGGPRGFSAGPLVRVAVPAAKVPIVGLQPEAEAEVRWGTFSYARAEARASQEIRLGRMRLAAVGDFAITSGDAPSDAYLALGDEHAVPGYRWGQERDRVRAIAGFDLAYPIPFQGYVKTRIRTGASVPELDALADQPWVTGGEIGVLWRTPFGSFAAGWGVNTASQSGFVVNLGQTF